MTEVVSFSILPLNPILISPILLNNRLHCYRLKASGTFLSYNKYYNSSQPNILLVNLLMGMFSEERKLYVGVAKLCDSSPAQNQEILKKHTKNFSTKTWRFSKDRIDYVNKKKMEVKK